MYGVVNFFRTYKYRNILVLRTDIPAAKKRKNCNVTVSRMKGANYWHARIELASTFKNAFKRSKHFNRITSRHEWSGKNFNKRGTK